jgi:hypothetical protein
MRRSAKILCAFGSIEFLCAITTLFIFDHIPYPWGAGTLAIGMGDETSFEESMWWQARVIVSCFGAAFVGAIFLLGSGVLYLASRFMR